MNLNGIPIAERKKLTSHYPLLIAAETGKGKSFAFSQLSAEDKGRTAIFNFDNKAISDDDSEFLLVKSGFDINDVEMVDKICKQILESFSYNKCDRIVIDTVTLMNKTINRWAVENYSGFDVWNAYNNSITQIIEAIKVGTLTYGKFGYVTGHYPPRDNSTLNTKRYLTTKGKEHTNVLEESFSTVVESVFEDRSVCFVADSFSLADTTKTKLVAGEFKFKRTSVDDLEQFLNGKKKVVDLVLVDV